MKRLEVIHLRLAGQRLKALIQEIRDSVIRHDPNMVIRIYQHAAVETDLSIHIQMAEPSENQVDAELGVFGLLLYFGSKGWSRTRFG